MPKEVQEYLQQVINREIKTLVRHAEALRYLSKEIASKTERDYFLKRERYHRVVSTLGEVSYMVHLPLGISANIKKVAANRWQMGGYYFESRKQAYQTLKANWNCAIASLFEHDGQWLDLFYKLECGTLYPEIAGLLNTWCREMDKQQT